MICSLYICGEIAGIDPPVIKRYQASFSPFFCLVLLNSLVMKINGNRKFFVYPGQRFGMLTIIKETTKLGNAGSKIRLVECLCDCGNLKTMFVSNLRKPYYANANCGCVSPHVKHGMTYTKIYKIWDGIMERTLNPNSDCYKNYGGRGISVCDSWTNPSIFITWALSNGYKFGLQIDRIDNEKGYYPENCHFVTPQINSLNRRKRDDYGIYYHPISKSYQVVLVRNYIHHYGGCTKDLSHARIIRDNLKKTLKNLLP